MASSDLLNCPPQGLVEFILSKAEPDDHLKSLKNLLRISYLKLFPETCATLSGSCLLNYL